MTLGNTRTINGIEFVREDAKQFLAYSENSPEEGVIGFATIHEGSLFVHFEKEAWRVGNWEEAASTLRALSDNDHAKQAEEENKENLLNEAFDKLPSA